MDRRGRVFTLPEIEQPVSCRLVPIAEPLIPFFRSFFETMQASGVWIDQETALRARDYWMWQEAMMICDLSGTLEQNNQEQMDNQNKNMCTLISILVPILTEGAIDPTMAMTICNLMRLAHNDGEGSPAWLDAITQHVPMLLESGVGKNTNQLEDYQKTIAELIGGDGVVEDVD